MSHRNSPFIHIHKCEKCNGEFDSAESLNHHINKYYNSSPVIYQCEQCEFNIDDEKSLTKHIQTLHRKETGFHCQPCDKIFGTAKDIPIHIETHHTTTGQSQEKSEVREIMLYNASDTEIKS